MKKASQFILAAEAASLLFGGAGCANPTAPVMTPAPINIEEEVEPGPVGPGPVGPEGPVIPEPVEPEGPVIPGPVEPEVPKFTAVTDIEFGEIDLYLGLGGTLIAIKAKMQALTNQAIEIREQYEELPGSDPASVFKERFLSMQKSVGGCTSHDSTSSLRAARPHSLFVDFFKGFPDWNGKALFIKQLEAFQKASHSSVRLAGDLAKRAAELETAWTAAMGDEPMPATAGEAAGVLKQALLGSLPECVGTPGPNLIQQVEDFAEFHGWTEEWEGRWNRSSIDGLLSVKVAKLTDFKITNPTDAQIAKIMPRKETDEENGIVV